MTRTTAFLLAIVAAGCTSRESTRRPAGRPTPVRGSSLSVLLVTIDTLRPDHMSVYGYQRRTSPHMDDLARRGTLFERAYTYWPKTRGSFVAIMTGRRASQTGYSKQHPLLLDQNPTLASVLRDAGYDTVAAVDNANVAGSLGFSKGFRSYRETWEEKALLTEADRSRAITESAVSYLGRARRERPFLLWLHYVDPHTPYTPPPPFDKAFLDASAAAGPRLPIVRSLHGGIPAQWAVPGRDRLGYYLAQYDGEIASVDEQVGRVLGALGTSQVKDSTMIVLASDHGESLGEHDYYFDHGEDLFDPSQRVPLLIVLPGAPAGRRSAALASTLDILPTILDGAKVSYPPDLAGRSLVPEVSGRAVARLDRLFGQNDRSLAAVWDERYKVVAKPTAAGYAFALYDRSLDPAETKDAARRQPDRMRVQRRELELFLDRAEQEWGRLRAALSKVSGEEHLSADACERLKAMGYAGCR